MLDKVVNSTVGAIIQRLSGLALTLYITNFLGLDALANYAALVSTVVMFGSFIGFGIGPLVSRYISRHRADESQSDLLLGVESLSFRITVSFGLVSAIIVYVIGLSLELKFEENVSFKDIFSTAPLIILAMALNAFMAGLFMGYERFKELGIFYSVQGVSTAFVVGVCGYFLGVDGVIVGYLVAQLISLLAGSLIFYRFSGRLIRVKLINTANLPRLSDVLKFGSSSMLSGVAQGVSNWLIVLLILDRGGSDWLAGYHVASQLYSLALFAPNLISQVLLPNFSRTRKFEFGNLILVYLGGSFLLLLGVIVFSGLIHDLFAGSLQNDDRVLYFIVLAATIFACKSPYEQVLLAEGRAAGVLSANIVFCVLYLSFTSAFMFSGIFEVFAAKAAGYLVYSIMLKMMCAKLQTGSV